MVACVKQIWVYYMFPRKLMKIRHKWWGRSTSKQSSISELPCFFMMLFFPGVFGPQNIGPNEMERRILKNLFPHPIPLRVTTLPVHIFVRWKEDRGKGKLANMLWRSKTLIFQKKNHIWPKVFIYKKDALNLPTPWKINMEPTNHPFRKENDLPNLHYYVPC